MQDTDGVLRVDAGARQLIGTAARARYVAERPELVHDAVVQHCGLHLLTRRSDVLQLRLEFLGLGPVLPDDVIGLARVGGQVVEFGMRSADVLPAVGANGPQFRPVHIHLWVEGLRVGDVRRDRFSGEDRRQTHALNVTGGAPAHYFEQCRKEVDGADLLFHT